MTGLPPAEEATHYSLLNGRRPRASSTSSGCDTSGHFGDVALCARIPQSGHFEAPSSPSGCFKRTLWGTLWGRSVMRPTAGHLALRPRSARARRTGRRTSPRAKAGQIRPRPRSVRPGPAAGHPPKCKRAAARGCGRRPGEGRAAARGGRRSKGRGPPRAPLPRRGRDPGGKGSRSPRQARGRAPRPAGG